MFFLFTAAREAVWAAFDAIEALVMVEAAAAAAAAVENGATVGSGASLCSTIGKAEAGRDVGTGALANSGQLTVTRTRERYR